MCTGMNPKRIDAIREAELKQKLAEAMAKDQSHIKRLSQN